MSERYRDKEHQYCDDHRCTVMDTVTGELVRVFPHNTAVGMLKDA